MSANAQGLFSCFALHSTRILIGQFLQTRVFAPLSTTNFAWTNAYEQQHSVPTNIPRDQLVYLQLSSETARQTVAVDCAGQSGVSLGGSAAATDSLRLLTAQGQLVHHKNYTTHNVPATSYQLEEDHNECSRGGQTNFLISSKQPLSLPVHEVSLPRQPHNSYASSVRITFGEVCFKGTAVGDELDDSDEHGAAHDDGIVRERRSEDSSSSYKQESTFGRLQSFFSSML